MYYFFLLLFIQQQPFRGQNIFFSSLDRVLRAKDVFSLVYGWYFDLDPDPWIRIYLRIRIQEAKMLQIQRIRILSTGFNKLPF